MGVISCCPFTHAVLAADPAESQVAKLVRDLPRPSALEAIKESLRSPTITSQAREVAERQLEMVQDRVPKIARLLQNRRSVFAYPGLLAAGDIGYRAGHNGTTGTYLLRIGCMITAEEFDRPPMIFVSFDDQGLITGVSTPGKLAQ